MPYAMSRLSLEMMEEFFEGDAATLGQLVRVSLQRMASAEPPKADADRYHRLIKEMGETLSPFPKLLPLERLEHAKLFHLLGDPLLKLARPQSLEIEVSDKVVAGSRVSVSGVAPSDGELQIELVYERDRFLKRPKRRSAYESSDAALRKYDEVYQQTQRRTVAKISVPVKRGSFEQVIDVPRSASGRCQIRAVVVGPEVFAMGASAVRVTRSDAVHEARK